MKLPQGFLKPLTTFVVITLIFGTIYAVAQQSLRLGANDLQIQIAEDTASALNAGGTPEALVSGHVDMSKSLAPFVIIYDQNYKVVASSGVLADQVPRAPLGILAGARNSDYHFVTWQPSSTVRIAAVSVAAKNYYVLSGRSLKEIERQEQHTMQLAALGWLASITVIGSGWALQYYIPTPKTRRKA